MKRLTKILLINWHMFTRTEIEVNNNMLITGHNGAGKSTLLDAVQYVLTGGRTKFNLAANEDGTRKLEGYVRGKLGIESREFLRTGDVTTHVALEFFDDTEKISFVLGAIVDLPEGGKCIENFYQLAKCGIDQAYYFTGQNGINSKRSFESVLKRNRIKYYFAQNKSDARNLVTKTLGLNSKYTELIPRALAFKPIGDLNDFMFRFLLPEEKVNIESLRENVQLYRKFENTLQEQQERLGLLSEIHSCGKKLRDLETDRKIASFISGKIFIEQNNQRLGQIEAELKACKKTQSLCRAEADRIRGKQEDIDRQLGDINSQINALDPDGLIATLTERVKNLKRSFTECENWQNSFNDAYKRDVSILEKLGINIDFHGDRPEHAADSGMPEFLNLFERRMRQLTETNAGRMATLELENTNAQQKLEDASKLVKTLEEKRHPYDRNVQALIDVLGTELRKAAGRDVYVKPFCEYLEITDDLWRNAIEGYLNTQRFDIFVEPVYFRAAAKIYEQFKAEFGIYGVGIVDSGKLSAYTEIKSGTLAEKVHTDNIYARQYANLILGKVDCEEDVEKLNMHKQAITPTCMIYRNYTVRAINPAVYRRPFIGLKAIELQLNTAREDLNVCRSELSSIHRRISDAQQQKSLLSQLDLSYVPSFAVNQQNYLSVEAELSEAISQLEQLQEDPSWITLLQQKNALEARRGELSNKIEQSLQSLSESRAAEDGFIHEQSDINNALAAARTAEEEQRAELIDHMQTVDRVFKALYRDSRSDYNRMRIKNDNRIRSIAEDIAAAELQLRDDMHAYNLRTSFGFEETAAALDIYDQQYDKLRTIEIEKTRNRAIEARIKCEQTFQEDFISKLRDKIIRARDNLNKLNKSLEDKSFQGDHYAFDVKPSSDQNFSQYYGIICSDEDYQKNTIFMEELSEHNRQLMDELFAKLTSSASDEKSERLLQNYTDYRKYMRYDIRITHANGDVTMFSRVNREKSGGETQTPFYVIIAASFDQLAASRRVSDTGCLVLFDEAFNNMDENRIEALMRFYSSLNIQLMIAVPEGRVRNIMPYTETTLLLVKGDNQISSKTIIHGTQN